MKRCLIIILLVATSHSLWGQRIRFSDTSNIWRMLGVSRGLGTESVSVTEFRYIGSKFVNGHQYMGIAGQFSGSDGSLFYREDTDAGKVFHLMPDSTEVLLYDYNLKVGDTLFNPASTTPSRVLDIDSTQIDHQWYKVWYFEAGKDGRFNYHIVEGLGCLQGMSLPVSSLLQSHYVVTSAFYQLRCFTNRGTAHPLSHPVSVVYAGVLRYSYVFDNANWCTLGVEEISTHAAGPYVAPNPIDESGMIVLPDVISGTIQVVNAIGSEAMKMPVSQTDEILIGPAITMPGVYYYRIIDNTGAIYSGTFVRR